MTGLSEELDVLKLNAGIAAGVCEKSGRTDRRQRYHALHRASSSF